MSAKRIIPCLDIKDGRVVKGVQFENLKDAGNAIEIAQEYSRLGADELVFLNISSSKEGKERMRDIVASATKNVDIPIIVGGGIGSLSDISQLFQMGVAKVSMGSIAVSEPNIIAEASKKFGSNRVIVAIDTKKHGGSYKVHIGGGKIKTNLDAVEWAIECQRLGAGEILLTSMDKDGTKSGYDLDITKQVIQAVSIPIIASGGAGNKEHFAEVLCDSVGASAALAASLFHFRQLEIMQLKRYLKSCNIDVKI